jgi:hypothetical protein
MKSSKHFWLSGRSLFLGVCLLMMCFSIVNATLAGPKPPPPPPSGPVVTITSPTNYQEVSGTAFDITATSDVPIDTLSFYIGSVSEETRIPATLDINNVWHGTWNTKLYSDGYVQLYTYATVNGENTLTPSHTVLVSNAPVVTMVTPYAYQYVAGATFDVSAETNVPVDGLSFYMGTVSEPTRVPATLQEDGKWHGTWDTTAYTDGTLQIITSTTDDGTDYLGYNIYVNVKNAPTVTFQLEPFGEVSGTAFALSASTDVPVDALSFYVGDLSAENRLTTTFQGDEKWHATWDTTNSPDGMVQLIASSTLNGIAYYEYVYVTVKNIDLTFTTPPSPTIGSEVSESINLGFTVSRTTGEEPTLVTLLGCVTDPCPGLQNVDGVWQAEVDTTLLPDGDHTFTAYAEFGDGAYGSTGYGLVIHNYQYEFVSPEGGAEYNSPVSFNATTTFALSLKDVHGNNVTPDSFRWRFAEVPRGIGSEPDCTPYINGSENEGFFDLSGATWNATTEHWERRFLFSDIQNDFAEQVGSTLANCTRQAQLIPFVTINGQEIQVRAAPYQEGVWILPMYPSLSAIDYSPKPVELGGGVVSGAAVPVKIKTSSDVTGVAITLSNCPDFVPCIDRWTQEYTAQKIDGYWTAYFDSTQHENSSVFVTFEADASGYLPYQTNFEVNNVDLNDPLTARIVYPTNEELPIAEQATKIYAIANPIADTMTFTVTRVGTGDVEVKNASYNGNLGVWSADWTPGAQTSLYEPYSIRFVATRGEETYTSEDLSQAEYPSEPVRYYDIQVTNNPDCAPIEARHSDVARENGCASGGTKSIAPSFGDKVSKAVLMTPYAGQVVTSTQLAISAQVVGEIKSMTFDLYTIGGSFVKRLEGVKEPTDSMTWSAQMDLADVTNGTYGFLAQIVTSDGIVFTLDNGTPTIYIRKPDALPDALKPLFIVSPRSTASQPFRITTAETLEMQAKTKQPAKSLRFALYNLSTYRLERDKFSQTTTTERTADVVDQRNFQASSTGMMTYAATSTDGLHWTASEFLGVDLEGVERSSTIGRPWGNVDPGTYALVAYATSGTQELVSEDVLIEVSPINPDSYSVKDVEAYAAAVSLDDDMGFVKPEENALGVKHVPACRVGKLYKNRIGSGVFYCGIDEQLHVFLTEKTFYSWFKNFSGLTVLTPPEFQKIPQGAPMMTRPGMLIKKQGDPKVYVVQYEWNLVGRNYLRQKVRRWINSETVAIALFGSDWNQKIAIVPEAEIRIFDTEDGKPNSRYKVGKDISSSELLKK